MNVSQQKISHHMLPEAHVLRHKLLGELHLLRASTRFSIKLDLFGQEGGGGDGGESVQCH
jgi:hypothetical protein